MRHSQLFTMSSYTYWAGLILEIPLKNVVFSWGLQWFGGSFTLVSFRFTCPSHVRLVLFCLVCLARHLIFVVENPSASLLPHHPRWNWFQNRCCWETCQIHVDVTIGIHVLLDVHRQKDLYNMYLYIDLYIILIFLFRLCLMSCIYYV